MSNFKKYHSELLEDIKGPLPEEAEKKGVQGNIEFTPLGDTSPVPTEKGPGFGQKLRTGLNVAGKVADAAMQITNPILGLGSVAKGIKAGINAGKEQFDRAKQEGDKNEPKNLTPNERAFIIAFVYSDIMKKYMATTQNDSDAVQTIRRFLKENPKSPDRAALLRLNLLTLAKEMFKDLAVYSNAQEFARQQPGSAYSVVLNGLMKKYA